VNHFVLGISALYHDSAASLVDGGKLVAAAQEERFSRKKHDPRFPRHAIRYCLEEAGIEPEDLAAVVFYDHPLHTLDRVIKSLASVAPAGREQWSAAVKSTLGRKLQVESAIRKEVGPKPPVLFARHHLSHAASAFYPSPFASAGILVMDGVGEWATTTLGRGNGERIELLEEIKYPHSLGLLYSAVTYFCGFKVNSGEYKLMGLAPYGRPIYVDLIREKLIHIREDGSYRLDTSYFGYLESNVMTNARFAELFGGPPREPESNITQREMDLAASIQNVLEGAVLKLAQRVKKLTGERHLVLAGGVALNCVANGHLLRSGLFEDLWIQPAAGDAGGALGAALLGAFRKTGAKREMRAEGRDGQRGSYLGPRYSSDEARAFLERGGYPFERVAEPEELAGRVAHELASGKVVGLLHGRMEFGPRSLGARSILGDPRNPDTQTAMNLKIKYRESFRPFAPSVLAERCSEYFELDRESPYMLLVAPVQARRRLPFKLPEWSGVDADMLPLVRAARSDIPAVTHIDYSARVQTVHAADEPFYHAVLQAFEKLTGCAVVVNTSFNVRGEPIVCSPKDAYTCFMRTEMDVLVLEDCIVFKGQQPAFKDTGDWRTEHELD
jgi:carbamoyltransferase